MIHPRCVCALAVVLLFTPAVMAADRDADERLLRAARIGTDGPALLTFFKNRVVSSADREKIAALIKKLGNDDFETREKASADLIALGGRAEALLREAARDSPDAEIKHRAEECMRQLSKEAEPTVLAAAARVLAERRPDGTAVVLLDYLPEAPDELVVEAVTGALEGVAVNKSGKADPVVVKALEDKSALRRAAAAVALVRAGGKEQMTAVRKLLEDRDRKVRLRVAVALVFAKDKEAVPALIELLGELPANDGYEAEDILRSLAGDASPDVPLGKDAAERKKCRAAWVAWWKKDAGKVDLTKLTEGTGSGRTLIVQMNGIPGKPAEGRVLEVGRDGDVRWKIEGLDTPIDAQMLPGGRVLICEYRTGRLTERNIKGEVLWEKKIIGGAAAGRGMLMGAQRLANGNTFVVTMMGLLELDRDGKEVWSHKITGPVVYAGRKSRTGEMAFVTSAGTCVLLDAKGKETASFPTGRVRLSSGIDLLPNGNVLVPDYLQSKVREYDPKGRLVWEASVQRPASAMRLANGHTLVTLMIGKNVIELDKDGKEVWKCETEGQAHKAYRR